MRTLIDGYNLMHAVGVMSQRFGPDGFRQARRRFLVDLAARLGPVEAAATTVVFDAAKPPDHMPRRSRLKEIEILFAVESKSADEQIEALIAAHSAPKTLTVVSSDRRIRQAATRRKARVIGADEFWSASHARPSRPAVTADERERPEALRPGDAAEWLEAFGHLDADPEFRDIARGPAFAPDVDEVRRIEREVAAEIRSGEALAPRATRRRR